MSNPPGNDTQETQNNESSMRFSQLEKEGFPLYIVMAFIMTARNTKTVICSRVPGKATTPLIADHHDLKSFQVKAKSCDWGPMSGFLCQLPYLNKKGAVNIDYNAGYIEAYLAGILRFTPIKKILESQVPSSKESAKELKNERINKLNLLRENEAKTKEWTGENNLPNNSPFIHLKRKFIGTITQVQKKLSKMKGIKNANINQAGNVIYGEAFAGDYSVMIKYAIQKDKDVENIWAIYHGEIKYRNTQKEDYKKVKSEVIPPEVNNEKISQKAQKESMERVFSFSEKTIEIDGETYFPIRGFMNAFPPFPEKIFVNDAPKYNPDFYKNAVTGDYDLFAIWPDLNLGKEDLVRVTEASIGKRLRMGGKIFTSFIGSKSDFAIEFIPGFKEINPNSKKGLGFSETADFGNINNLGRLIAGTLNSSAASTESISGNKAFHSDEGGRPGIMEIEFPVAVFFPKVLATKALNNADKEPEKFKKRSAISATSGIVKSPIEIVALNLECLQSGYRVMMHSDWMMHLFFCSLTKIEQEAFWGKKGDVYKDCTKDKSNTTSEDKIDKKLKEFKTIYDVDQELKYDREEYLRLLKILVLAKLESWKITGSYNDEEKKYPLYFIDEIKTFDKQETELFEQLRRTVLSFAFQPSRESIQKRREFEAVLISKPRADFTVQEAQQPHTLRPTSPLGSLGSIFNGARASGSRSQRRAQLSQTMPDDEFTESQVPTLPPIDSGSTTLEQPRADDESSESQVPTLPPIHPENSAATSAPTSGMSRKRSN